VTTLTAPMHGWPLARTDWSITASLFSDRSQSEIREHDRSRMKSATGERRIANPIAEIAAGREESRELEKHGDFVAPTETAIIEAETLIKSMPSWMPVPHPVMEHDGAIGLQWDVGRGRFFVVAVDGTGHVEYSAILGFGKEHSGRTTFTGRMPDEATSLLAKLTR